MINMVSQASPPSLPLSDIECYCSSLDTSSCFVFVLFLSLSHLNSTWVNVNLTNWGFFPIWVYFRPVQSFSLAGDLCRRETGPVPKVRKIIVNRIVKMLSNDFQGTNQSINEVAEKIEYKFIYSALSNILKVSWLFVKQNASRGNPTSYFTSVVFLPLFERWSWD